MDIENKKNEANGESSKEQKYQFCLYIIHSADSASISELKDARNILQVLGRYKDSEQLLKECLVLLDKKNNTNSDTENAAKKEIEKKGHKKRVAWIVLASSAVAAAITTIIIMLAVVKPASAYNKAIALFEEQRYDEAIGILNTMTGYKDARSKIYQIKTEKANHLFEDGKKEEAIDLAYEIGDKDFIFQLEASVLKKAAVGSSVYFGNFYMYQDAVIPWTVIAKDGNRMLLFADREVEKKKYDDNGFSYKWELCSLRHFLNTDFYEIAFSEKERNIILLSTIDNAHYYYWQYYNKDGSFDTTYAEDATKDYVFLLSFGEVWYKYKIDKLQLDTYGSWYTRSAGWDIHGEEDSDVYHNQHHGGSNLVRPAIWVDISSIA